MNMFTRTTNARRAIQISLVAVAMLVSLAIPSTAEANNEHYYYYSSTSTPCPNWSVDDVLADIDGDWDGDRVSNGDELFHTNGLNPCVHDSKEFCANSATYCRGRGVLWSDVEYYLIYAPVKHNCVNGYWTWSTVNSYPNQDWDGDGVANIVEAKNGMNPCVAPCPTAYNVDVALNPWGDWDGDGRSNQSEVQNHTNPCVYNQPVHVPQVVVTYVPPTRLPHVSNYTVPAPPPPRLPHVSHYPTPTPKASPCPAGFPYFHKGNGQCYANPVNTPLGW